MESINNSRPRILKTPLHRIPLGVPFKSSDGRYGIRVKKPQGKEYEDLLIESLISMVISEAEAQYGKEQVPRSEGTAAESKI